MRTRTRKLSYELLECSLHGHVFVGTDAAAVRPEDYLVAREYAGLRWHRCLRCDAWMPQQVPATPARPFPPERAEITIPLRGRPLRDKYVLRLIAVDRAIHFVVLAVLAVAIFLFAANKPMLQQGFMRFLTDTQAGVGGPANTASGGVEGELTRLFAINVRSLQLVGVAIIAYALLEGVEAVGLWHAKRWAEYLTFVATVVLVPLEVYEISHRPTALKGLTLAINLAIVVYLVVAKRLFGIRGGQRAERERRRAEGGWAALEHATPTGDSA